MKYGLQSVALKDSGWTLDSEKLQNFVFIVVQFLGMHSVPSPTSCAYEMDLLL